MTSPIAKKLPSEAQIRIASDAAMWWTDPIETTLELLRTTRECVRKSEGYNHVLRERLKSTMKKIRRTEILLLRSDAAIKDFTTLRFAGRHEKRSQKNN